ncbi:hypothetical protein K501DRAFT_264490 [Backusella circina FSU 941]|nr:hypothetical protein K501DRAFT_264490 [Backusella circina FSU 941]
MSTYSKNLFDVLGDGEPVRPAPVKEEAPVVVDQKVAAKMTKDAARAAKGSNNRRQGGRPQKEGRPQRGRQFDRHSGTGIVDSDKKVKQGWGNPETAEAEAAADVLSPSDPDAAEKEVAAPAEPEEVVKTLDEYLAEKANKSLKVSLPEARKANDSDEAAFKGTVAFAKEEFQEFYVAKETKSSKKTEKVRKEKVFVEIEQRFQEKARPEFRKNDRRGGRGNGRRTQKNSASPAVNLEDSSAFPSLGATA